MQAPEKHYNAFAIAALALVAIGLPATCLFPCLGALLWIAALPAGMIAHMQIKASGGNQIGEWMAILGMVIGTLVGLVLVAISAVLVLSLSGPQISNVFSRITAGTK